MKITKLEGHNMVIRQLNERKAGTIIKFRRGIKASANKLLELSQPLVPEETGALKASGRVQVVGQGFATEAFVIYGGEGWAEGYREDPDLFYAVHVHENKDAYHEPPTQAKFLEQPARQNKKEIAAAFKAEVAK